jgi:hypothetical protein
MAYAFVGVYDAYATTQDMAHSIKEMLPHPLYTFLEHDQMIVILDGQSNNTPVRVNFDPNIPSDLDEITLIGLGLTETGLLADKLRELKGDVVPNEQCSPFFDEGYVQDDMVCMLSQDRNSQQCKFVQSHTYSALSMSVSVNG